jgi:hypothetical protein
MKPIVVSVEGIVQVTSTYFCEQLLDLNRWTDFTGYKLLPGIQFASFIHRTDHIVGTRVKVINTDGSTHEEEFLEWNPNEKLTIRLSQFSKPLSFFSTHFLEEFHFEKHENGTKVKRTMYLFPKNGFGALILRFISRYTKKALEIQAKIPL